RSSFDAACERSSVLTLASSAFGTGPLSFWSCRRTAASSVMSENVTFASLLQGARSLRFGASAAAVAVAAALTGGGAARAAADGGVSCFVGGAPDVVPAGVASSHALTITPKIAIVTQVRARIGARAYGVGSGHADHLWGSTGSGDRGRA